MTERRARHIFPAALLALVFILSSVVPAGAYTPWNGLFFLENSYATTTDSKTNLFQSGVSLSIKPPTKKSLDTRLNVRLDYTNSAGDSVWNLSPVGNLGIDMNGENFSFNLEHLRSANVTTDAQLVESKTYRASLTLYPVYWPRLTTSYSHQEQATDGVDSSIVDLYSLYADYDFRKWLSVRAGYDLQEQDTGENNITSDSMQVGLSIHREFLPRTTAVGDMSMVRSTTESGSGLATSSDDFGGRVGFDSRPIQLVGVGGSYSFDRTTSESDLSATATTSSSTYDLTTTIYPLAGLRLWGTFGNRTFDGGTEQRSVDYRTLAGSINRDISEQVSMNLSSSRTLESDPDQGDNTRDSVNLNTLITLTPRADLRFNLNVTRNESPDFVDTEGYDASGPLADRDLYDNESLGFTFFDTDNDNLYTKQSILVADWSAPVPIEPPVTEKFLVTKSLQANLRATDKLSMILYYSLNFSSDKLDLVRSDRQVLNSSIIYQPNRRTSYSATGNYSTATSSRSTYSGTFSFNYRFFRGDQLNMSYGLRSAEDKISDNLSVGLRLAFRKRNSLDLTYSSSELFAEDQTHFFRARFIHTF